MCLLFKAREREMVICQYMYDIYSLCVVSYERERERELNSVIHTPYI